MPDNVRIVIYHTAAWSARFVLLALVAIAPWVYGGQFWWTQVGIVYGGVLLAGLTWVAASASLRRVGSCTPLTYAMLAFMLVVAAQLVPLPSFLASRMSTAHHFLQEIYSDVPPATTSRAPGATTGKHEIWQDPAPHRTLSILPLQTQGSLAVFAVAVVAVWSASLLFVNKRWAIVLALTLAISGLMNAFLGLVQVVSWNGWTLLPNLREISFSTFISRNSAPDFFATSIGALFALLGITYRSQKQKRRKDYRATYQVESWQGRLRSRMEDIFIDLNTPAVMCMCAIAFMLVATLATLSRGGAVASVGATVTTIFFAVGVRSGLMHATSMSAVIGLMVIGTLAFFGLDSEVADRINELNEVAYTGTEGRFLVWKYSLASLSWYWLFGAGLGTYHFAILPFHTEGPDVWFYHAENLFLEIACETGLVGTVIAFLALGMVAKKISRQTAERKEKVLLIGAAFATAAISLHALVDFRLILPGVFLPYGALIGAFMGRCRRIESEQAYRESLGEKHSQDARVGVRRPSAERMRGRWLGHTVVAVISILCMINGLSSARGFAAAEGLVENVKLAEAQIEKNEAVDRGALGALLEETSLRHGTHPEVELQAGRLELLLWQLHAREAVEWPVELNPTQLANLSTPQVMTAMIRSPIEQAATFRQAIQQDVPGIELARSSFARFQIALAACPFDERALWGVLTTDAKWLSPHARSAARRILSRLAGNNSKMLMKEGLVAIQEGSRSEGLVLMKQAVELNRQRLHDALEALIGFVDAQDLLGIAPNDTVFLASICREAATKGELGKALADRVIKERLQADQLEQVTQTNADGWAGLAWVAFRLDQRQRQVELLRKAVSQARDRHALRFELAQAEYAAGMVQEAIKDLGQCIKMSPTSAQYKTLLEEWTQSLDQNR